MVKQKFSGGQRFCAAEKFFGASGDVPFGFFSITNNPFARMHAYTQEALPLAPFP